MNFKANKEKENMSEYLTRIIDEKKGFIRVKIKHLNILKFTSIFLPLFIARSLFRVIKRKEYVKKILSNYYFKNFNERKRNRIFLKKIREDYKPSNNPLVSVLIPTFNRGDVLTKRALPSVLAQTYQNFEIAVVGDCCTDNTEELLKKIRDKRIRFYNLSERGHYPENPARRWLVAGVAPENKGLELCRGDWIAHLDDDDEFSRDHIEVLLKKALEENYEMVYGKVKLKFSSETREEILTGSETISHSAVLINSKLRFFKYDINCWKYGEPADIGVWRRMKEAGVRIGFVDKVVATRYIIPRFESQFSAEKALF